MKASSTLRGRLGLAWLIICILTGGYFVTRPDVQAAESQPTKQITKKIEDIKVGDYVLAKDPSDPGPPTPHRVVALPRNWTEHIVHIRVEGGGELQATRTHPFWVQGRGWKSSKDIRPGASLCDDSGHPVIVTQTWVETKIESTFNLTVDGVHTYFVSANGANVLVHNANADQPPPWFQQQSWDQDLEEGASSHDQGFWGGNGVVYRVDGSNTASGMPYVGSSDNWPVRQNFSGDGRMRKGADVIGRYPSEDQQLRRQAEQQGINDNGGKDNLDNKRDEIAGGGCE